MSILRPAALAVLLALAALPARADEAGEVLRQWYRLVLELVRHTPTYSPPVASRAFAYLGVTAWEVAAQDDPALVSLAGQLTDLPPTPPQPAGEIDAAAAIHAAMATAVPHFFGNTGPTGQRAMAAMTETLGAQVADGLDPATLDRSTALGQAIAAHIIAWAAEDGGAEIENMGFPLKPAQAEKPSDWVPTSTFGQQQAPLLPFWGTNRPFALPSAAACAPPGPPPYSEEPGSAFHAEAMEVYETSKALTDDQKRIARFWSDDPMLSPTPPGHWVYIARDLLDAEEADLARSAEVMARLGVAMADAFISCWHTKYTHNLLRPVTYIRRVIDPAWEPLLITPPFPEYTSGHSAQSGAAAVVLSALWGEGFAFTDRTHEDDGMAARDYPSFRAAAAEAAVSRLYGGIHFRSAIDHGLAEGDCVGQAAARLRMRAP